jgi:hypothetical protein
MRYGRDRGSLDRHATCIADATRYLAAGSNPAWQDRLLPGGLVRLAGFGEDLDWARRVN